MRKKQENKIDSRSSAKVPDWIQNQEIDLLFVKLEMVELFLIYCTSARSPAIAYFCADAISSVASLPDSIRTAAASIVFCR